MHDSIELLMLFFYLLLLTNVHLVRYLNRAVTTLFLPTDVEGDYYVIISTTIFVDTYREEKSEHKRVI